VLRIWRWLGRHELVASALIVTLVAAPAYLVQEIRVSCIEDWAAQSTERLERLGTQNREWRDGLTDVLRTARSGDRVKAQADFDRWIGENDELNRKIEEHPIPDAPSLRC
jgi:hypothetical protein